MSFVLVREFNKWKDRVTELQARVQALETFHQGEPIAEKKEEVVPTIQDAIEEEASVSVEELFGSKIGGLLMGDGLDTVDKIDQATDDRLLRISGIGAATVLSIREGLEELWAR